ncbi:Lrp/AsnC family transcriptional regulator [Streptomyces sp. ODS28]|uniref:Lrp/AsnC family transcriptional regulator n=1 Tax=Streptomyces sp. ODS28 TaxID=3136688 RepID=UPI0031EB926D
MPETDTPSELDLALAHALQLRPRASWAELAPPLGVSASTLARRWARLREAGLAWVTAAPGPAYARSRCTAFVLVRCAPGARERLMRELAAYPQVATVEAVTSGGDVLLDVLTPDLPALGALLTGELEHLDGLTSLSCMIATSLRVEGSRWRLRSLDPAQRTALREGDPRPQAERTGGGELDALDRALLRELLHDGRLTWAELAPRTGASTATVRRRLRRLESSGLVTFRCDLAETLAGRPVPVTLLARVPAPDVDAAHQVVAALPECRLVAAVTGPANILATLWVHDLSDLHRVESALCTRLPGLTVTDRIVGLYTVKRMGHLLDREGRHEGVGEFGPW